MSKTCIRVLLTLVLLTSGLMALGVGAGTARAREGVSSVVLSQTASRPVIGPLSGEPDTGGQSAPQAPKSSRPAAAFDPTDQWARRWIGRWIRIVLATPALWGHR